MSKIPLRVYNQEIEEAIEQKQIEEAIAHCQHILKSYRYLPIVRKGIFRKSKIW